MTQGTPAASILFNTNSSTSTMLKLSKIKSLSEKYRDLMKKGLVYGEKLT